MCAVHVVYRREKKKIRNYQSCTGMLLCMVLAKLWKHLIKGSERVHITHCSPKPLEETCVMASPLRLGSSLVKWPGGCLPQLPYSMLPLHIWANPPLSVLG